jgi:acetyltransferase-like isoleucine patch superfamily enzyme
MRAEKLVCEQPTHSRGITIGEDVWLGANVGVVDGVTIEAHAVVGMGSQVTRDIAAFNIVAGNPVHRVGDRREKI